MSIVIQSRPHIRISGLLLELWKYRYVLRAFLVKDLVVRYRETFAGIAWMILQPLAYFTIIYIVFKNRFTADIDMPYGQYLFLGIIIWIFFSNALLGASESIYQNGHLISKVYFPRVLLPITNVTVKLIDAGVMVFVYFLFATFNNWPMSAFHFLLVFLVILSVWLLVLGVSIITASLVSLFRDLHYILPFLVQLLFFATPIFYAIPNHALSAFFGFNPLATFLSVARDGLGNPALFIAWICWILLSLLLVIISLAIARALETKYMDKVHV